MIFIAHKFSLPCNLQVEISQRGKGNKKEGTALIRTLIGHNKTLTLSMNKDNSSGKMTGMRGAASGATNNDVGNESNGVRTNVTVNIGIGNEIFSSPFSGGKTSKETMSTHDLFNHEFGHAIAQMNGEAHGGTRDNTPIMYIDDKGVQRTEMIPPYEFLTIFSTRHSRRIPGYTYPSENRLRQEQGKNRRVNYVKKNQIGK